jgi:hypothetical protein
VSAAFALLTPAEGRVARLMVTEQEAMKLVRPMAEGRALRGDG